MPFCNLEEPSGSSIIPYSLPRLCPISVCLVLCGYGSFLLTENALLPGINTDKRRMAL